MSVCVISTSQRMTRFWFNAPQVICYILTRSSFLGFWKFKFDDVMTAILYVFECDTLTGAILLRLYCYSKSAKWVDNFRTKKKIAAKTSNFFYSCKEGVDSFEFKPIDNELDNMLSIRWIFSVKTIIKTKAHMHARTHKHTHTHTHIHTHTHTYTQHEHTHTTWTHTLTQHEHTQTHIHIFNWLIYWNHF